jgi:cellulose synthase (UDP-forming)
MPRLDLFAKAGFPFTRKADLSETAIVLPSNASPAQIGLALDAIAFLAGHTGSPATWVSFINTADVERTRDKDLLMIGSPQDQVDLQSKTAAIPLVYQESAFRNVEPRRFWDRYFAIPWAGYGKERRKVQEFLGGDGPVQAVLQGAELASGNNRSIVQLLAMTAEDAEGIFPAIESAAASDDIFGNVSLQRAGHYQSFRLADEAYSAGNLGMLQSFDHWMTKYLLFIPLLVLLCTLPLAPMIETFVERRRKERLEFDEELTV